MNTRKLVEFLEGSDEMRSRQSNVRPQDVDKAFSSAEKAIERAMMDFEFAIDAIRDRLDPNDPKYDKVQKMSDEWSSMRDKVRKLARSQYYNLKRLAK